MYLDNPIACRSESRITSALVTGTPVQVEPESDRRCTLPLSVNGRCGGLRWCSGATRPQPIVTRRPAPPVRRTACGQRRCWHNNRWCNNKKINVAFLSATGYIFKITMTVKELQYLASEKPEPGKIGTSAITEGGTSHPLWDILNNRFPPNMPWRQLGGAIRGRVVRAGELLHEQGIPYNFYAEFIYRFDKVYLKRTPMALFGYKQKKNGAVPLLREYLLIMDRLRQLWDENPATFRINDAVYKMFPGSNHLGVLKFMYSVGAIHEALKTQDEQQVLRLLSRASTIEEFWTALGYQAEKPAAPAVDLTEGQDHSEVTKVLGRELQIRLGNVEGQPNPKLDRYFNNRHKLNAYGLKVISGERPL